MLFCSRPYIYAPTLFTFDNHNHNIIIAYLMYLYYNIFNVFWFGVLVCLGYFFPSVIIQEKTICFMRDYIRDRLAGDLRGHFLPSLCAMLNGLTSYKIMHLVFALDS